MSTNKELKQSIISKILPALADLTLISLLLWYQVQFLTIRAWPTWSCIMIISIEGMKWLRTFLLRMGRVGLWLRSNIRLWGVVENVLGGWWGRCLEIEGLFGLDKCWRLNLDCILTIHQLLWFLLCLLPHLSLFPRRLIIVNVGATTIRYVGFRACFFLNWAIKLVDDSLIHLQLSLTWNPSSLIINNSIRLIFGRYIFNQNKRNLF